MDLGDIANGALNIATGGIFGAVTAGVQRFADYKNKQLDLEGKKIDIEVIRVKNDGELKLREVDAKIQASEAEGRYRVAKEEGETRREVAETEAFGGTLFREPGSYIQALPPTASKTEKRAAVFLDIIRGLVRPLITLYLVVLTTLIYYSTTDAILKDFIVRSVLFLTSTAVMHYFGTRNKQKHPKL